MQGRGVTNYSSNPSHSFSTRTTEFDDALLDRNIISFEQAMMAKGASPDEAKRLALLKTQRDKEASEKVEINYMYDAKHKRAEEDCDASDHDEALTEYRSRRLMQLKHGNVIPIQRNEWNEEVNEASHSQWVVIVLTSTSSAPNLNPYHRDQCLKMEKEVIPSLAGKFSEVKWISIPSRSAIENWPDDNLPTLFCYRKGKLQCQLVGLGDFGEIVADSLEFKLGELGVLESDLEYDPSRAKRLEKHGSANTCNSYGRSKFNGGMATYATNDEALSDYDDVD